MALSDCNVRANSRAREGWGGEGGEEVEGERGRWINGKSITQRTLNHVSVLKLYVRHKCTGRGRGRRKEEERKKKGRGKMLGKENAAGWATTAVGDNNVAQ